MQAESAPPDKMVARIAARQHGVITFGQLLGAGLSKGGVLRRERRGWLHRIHRGVYAVGHPSIGAEGRYMAAVLACGRGTTLSHRSAAGLWLLLPAALGDVHVVAAGRGSRGSRSGIRRHRSSTLADADTTRRKGIIVTTVARTIEDLRRTESQSTVRQAARQAAVLGLRSGLEHQSDRTRSELERRLLWICRRSGIPLPG